MHRTSLESQKLSLMGEVSYLKLKLSDMEGKQDYGAERQYKAEVGSSPTHLCGKSCSESETHNKQQEFVIAKNLEGSI